MSRTVRYNIEVKDSVVKATAYDEYGEYVSEVTCDDSSSESVIKATKKAIIHAGENMKVSWPKCGDLYYTPHFANNDLVRSRTWIDCAFDRDLKKNNLVFRTKEVAAAAAKKMLEAISPRSKEEKKMSRTVHYDTNGNEIYEEDCINDAPTYPQEQLADIERREAVNHPSYYKTGGIEAIDVIEAWNLDFCLGNTVKYIARCGKKSDKVLEDLKKAAWYLNREIEKIRDIERKKSERWVKRLMERKERGDEESGSVQ